MTKSELEVKLEALKQIVSDSVLEQQKYQAQILDLEKQLKDINKPKLTPIQFDELHGAIEEAVGQFDFDDTDNYSYDFHIDYDNRIAIEAFSFDNAYDLGQEIYSVVAELFAEAECPNEDSNQENQD